MVILTDIKKKVAWEFRNIPKNLVIFVVLFSLWFLSFSKMCPCPSKSNVNNSCKRVEILGVQYNHIYYFFLLGYFFPKHFYTVQALGVLWELFEYLIDIRFRKDNSYLKNIGGCLKIGHPKFKYVNPIDRIFNIKKSNVHGWHHSIAEIVINIIFFKLGQYIYFKYADKRDLFIKKILPIMTIFAVIHRYK